MTTHRLTLATRLLYAGSLTFTGLSALLGIVTVWTRARSIVVGQLLGSLLICAVACILCLGATYYAARITSITASSEEERNAEP